MDLSQDAVQRLARLGYVTADELKFWHGLWASEGESFFWSFLREDEENAEEYRLWSPRIQAYAAECRRLAPAPALASLSHEESEQYRILLAKMREFAASEERRVIIDGRPNHAAILSTPWVGLAAAEKVFDGARVVILEHSEQERWFSDVYKGSGETFGWCGFAYWTIQAGLAGEDEEWILQRYPIPADHSYWVVVSGMMWGSMAGGAYHELWRWDGRRADLLGGIRIDTY